MSVYDGIMQGLEEALEHAKTQARKKPADIKPLREFAPEEIRELRIELGWTQVAFAAVFGVSAKTVEAWEAGRNKPEGPARRMLTLAQNDPAILNQFVV